MADLSKLKVAIVCDWLTGIGGAERVVLELHKMFPQAPIYTSQYEPRGIDWFKDADVRTTWLQKLPPRLKKFLPVLRAYSFSRLNLSEYDLVISSSGAEAKGVKTGPHTLHICYCLAPTHYYWVRYDEYLKNPGFGALDWLARIGLKSLVRPLKRWDFRAAQHPDVLVAISTYIQEAIKKYYGRDSQLVFPPVAIERFEALADKPNRSGFVTAGRQTPYKRFDLAVAACTQLGIPLPVIGNGPEHARLVKMAGPTISFETDLDDAAVAAKFASAEGFIFPTNTEDFGITPVEAMAAGTPVISYNQGGPRDYVLPRKTGVFFEELNVDAVVAALKDFQSQHFDHAAIAEQARNFSAQAFQNNMHRLISDYLDQKQGIIGDNATS